ncbi:hypothetical protein [Eubacterium sp. MSJ-33]|uniref:hypothetical protein n=1 Tax=Eubacterium sp. MSJ-33 TaxID=2841528 RepID=UPI001C7925AF|nr:hypothetical protein [Eubacterium sp. MSJ-33]QWT52118.1 hypothetical protein KP625_08415 [Eubacterium sp. MSJ-33]
MRQMLVYPSVLLMLVILNPWLYGHVWLKLIKYAFWRMLWMIPVILVIGVAVVDLACVVKQQWLKCAIVLACAGLIMFSGDNIYRQEGVYVKAENAHKLPQAAVDITHWISERDEDSTILAPEELYCYIRQYDGRIKMLYGRDADTYILPIVDAEMLELIQMARTGIGDPQRFTELARQMGANYIILPTDSGLGMLDNYGYSMVCSMHGYYIYQQQ